MFAFLDSSRKHWLHGLLGLVTDSETTSLTTLFSTGDKGDFNVVSVATVTILLVSGLQKEILLGLLCSSAGLVSNMTASDGDLRSLTTLRFDVTVNEVIEGLTGSEAEVSLDGVKEGLGLGLVGMGGAEDTTKPLLPLFPP